MIFKVYSTIVLGQAQTYSQDLKLAHYLKVPPQDNVLGPTGHDTLGFNRPGGRYELDSRQY